MVSILYTCVAFRHIMYRIYMEMIMYDIICLKHLSMASHQTRHAPLCILGTNPKRANATFFHDDDDVSPNLHCNQRLLTSELYFTSGRVLSIQSNPYQALFFQSYQNHNKPKTQKHNISKEIFRETQKKADVQSVIKCSFSVHCSFKC